MGRIGILYVIDTLAEGDARWRVAALARALDRSVFEPRVVCLGRDESPEPPGVECLGLRRAYGPSAMLAARRLARRIRESRFRIVHAFSFGSSIFGAALARFSGAKLVVTKSAAGLENAALKKIASRFPARFAEIVCTDSRAVAGYLETVEKIPTEKITVIHGGIAIDKGENAQGADMDVLANIPNYSPYRRTVGAASPLTPVKNHAILLHAARMVLRRYPATQFLLVGDGPERSRLERLAGRLGIAGRVVFVGETDDAGELMARMDVFVLPSLYEGLPDALLGAMAAGLPVIATECGGCGEAVAHGETGYLFDPESAPQLADHIVALLKDKQLARSMGLAGRERVLANFPMRKMVRAHERMYVEMLGAVRLRRIEPESAPECEAILRQKVALGLS